MRLLLLALLPACLPDLPERDFVENPERDSDGDGYTEVDGDCDDASAAVYPGAPEICDARDNDCDGRSDELVDADDGNHVEDPPTWVQDNDGDGFGNDAYTEAACTAPDGYTEAGGDCDDTLPSVFPDAVEVCDGLDDDCDGRVDDADDDMTGDATWYRDADADGYGNDAETRSTCAQPAGYVLTGGDCDDSSRNSWPGASERCDGRDNDCDGLVDDADPDGVVGPLAWFADTDGDGFGDPGAVTEACEAPAGHVEDPTDCDDGDATVHPGADERCATEGVDDDCDGIVDEADAADAPSWYADSDGDGFGDPDRETAACAAPAFFVADATDCDDGRDGVYPGASERCSTPTLDDDCDGSTNDEGADGCSDFFRDGDADGFGDGAARCLCTADTGTAYTASVDGDCDDGLSGINPGALESCGSTEDDDCDGDTNDIDAAGCAYFHYDYDEDGYGLAEDRLCLCVATDPYDATSDGDCDDLDFTVNPAATETCFDGVDNDCSGDADGSDAVDATAWYRDADADGYGLVAYAQTACEQPTGYAAGGGDCDDTRSGLNPGETEDCLTSFDDDCSGSTNDVGADACTTFYADADGDGYGLASDTQCTCIADTRTDYTSRVTGDCLDSDAAVSPSDTESCATPGVDDDCDGTADEANATGCTNYFYDHDGDGYGTSTSQCLCSASGYYSAARLGDCDDADNTVSPALANCGLQGTVSTSDATAVITGRTHYVGLDNLAAVMPLDYNRDGYVDVVVGDGSESDLYSYEGGVYIWLGSASGFTGSHAASASGDANLVFRARTLNGACGTYASAGDIDADGYDEVVVGCYGGSAGYVIDDGLDGTGVVTPATAGVTTLSGYPAAAAIPDVNGDGIDDALVGTEPNFRDGGTTTLAWGSPTGLSVSSTTVNIAYRTSGDSAGFSRAYSTGDIDGDGVQDLVMQYASSPMTTGVAIHAGGTAFSSTPSFTMATGRETYSAAVRAIGDGNGDGYDDVAVTYMLENGSTDPYTGRTETYIGAAWVLAGGVGPTTGEPSLLDPSGTPATDLASGYAWKMVGASDSAKLGVDMGSMGDLDADGHEDFGIASQDYYSTQSSYLVYGPLDFSSSTYESTDADATFSGLQMSIEPAGDMNSDGYDDLWVGGYAAYLFSGTPR